MNIFGDNFKFKLYLFIRASTCHQLATGVKAETEIDSDKDKGLARREESRNIKCLSPTSMEQ